LFVSNLTGYARHLFLLSIENYCFSDLYIYISVYVFFNFFGLKISCPPAVAAHTDHLLHQPRRRGGFLFLFLKRFRRSPYCLTRLKQITISSSSYYYYYCCRHITFIILHFFFLEPTRLSSSRVYIRIREKGEISYMHTCPSGLVVIVVCGIFPA